MGRYHNKNYLFPIGYKAVRFYWSMRSPGARCRYMNSVADSVGQSEPRPEFQLTVVEEGHDDVTFHDTSAKRLWSRVFERIEPLRNASRQQSSAAPLLRLFPALLSGEEMFGLAEPAFLRVLESVCALNNTLYKYRYIQVFAARIACTPIFQYCSYTVFHLNF